LVFARSGSDLKARCDVPAAMTGPFDDGLARGLNARRIRGGVLVGVSAIAEPMSYGRRIIRQPSNKRSAIAELPTFYAILGLTRIENDVPERFSATVIYLGGERWLPN